MNDRTPIPHALKRFEDHKDNPMVQALARFINLNLERSLNEVASWGVEVSEKRLRAFYLKFTDGTTLNGELEEVWTVRVFDASIPSMQRQQESEAHP